LLYVLGAVASVLLVLQLVIHAPASPRPDPSLKEAANPVVIPTAPMTSPVPSATTANDSSSYAIPLSELQGLSAQAEPGSSLQIWAAWSRPVTNGPRVQKLVGDVVLEKILPPVTDAEPPTVLLSVPQDDLPRLIYGNRFGALSASVTAAPDE
jgi:hypothetical protein